MCWGAGTEEAGHKEGGSSAPVLEDLGGSLSGLFSPPRPELPQGLDTCCKE